MAAKTMANSTEMKVNSAEKVATLERASKVRGSEKRKDTTIATTEKAIVQAPWLVTVLSHSAPIKTCKPYKERLEYAHKPQKKKKKKVPG